MKVLVAVNKDTCVDSIKEVLKQRDWLSDTEFLVVNVVEPAHGVEAMLPPSVSKAVAADHAREARELVRDVAIAIRDTLHTPRVSENVFTGNPKIELPALCKEWLADLIIIGCRDKSDLKLDEYLKGSVSEAVLHEAPASICLVRPPKSEKGDQPAGELVKEKW